MPDFFTKKELQIFSPVKAGRMGLKKQHYYALGVFISHVLHNKPDHCFIDGIKYYSCMGWQLRKVDLFKQYTNTTMRNLLKVLVEKEILVYTQIIRGCKEPFYGVGKNMEKLLK